MRERSVNIELMTVARRWLPGVHIIKHCDKFTVGVPDNSFSWAGSTSWLEIKVLRGNKTVHDELGPGQLETCQKLEQQTGRCWIVAYRFRDKRVLIYRPTALARGELPDTTPPPLKKWDDIGRRAWGGAIHFEGFDHRSVVELIRQTHDV